jgi:hypothetical protein
MIRGTVVIIGGDGCLNDRVTITGSGLAAAVSKVSGFEGLYRFALIPNDISTAI